MVDGKRKTDKGDVFCLNAEILMSPRCSTVEF